MRLSKKTRGRVTLVDYLRRKGQTMSDLIGQNGSYDDVAGYCEDFHLVPPTREEFDGMYQVSAIDRRDRQSVLDESTVATWEKIFKETVSARVDSLEFEKVDDGVSTASIVIDRQGNATPQTKKKKAKNA